MESDDHKTLSESFIGDSGGADDCRHASFHSIRLTFFLPPQLQIACLTNSAEPIARKIPFL